MFVSSGVPDKPTFVIGGYIPNSTYTELKGIYLGCWGPDGLEWFTKVGEYVVEQAKLVFPEFAEVQTKKRTKIKVAENEETKKRTTVKNKPNTKEEDKTGTENV